MTDEMRLLALEEKITYQERTIEALNEVIIGQQKQLDRLEEEIGDIRAMVAGLAQSSPRGSEPPPPHY